MSLNRNTNVNQTFIIDSFNDAVFSACTAVYTDMLSSCQNNVIFIDSDILTNGNYSGTSVYATTYYGDGSNLTNVSRRNEKTLITNDNTLTVIDTITGITENTSRFVEVFVTAHSGVNNYGFWKRTIGVSNFSGSTTVFIENYDVDKQSNNLNPTDISFSGLGSDVLILVSGELSKSYNWISDWEIIKR